MTADGSGSGSGSGSPKGAATSFALIPLGSSDAAACEGGACLIPGSSVPAPTES
ncbi:hypothetical protein [Leifsonia sp. NPDC058230]|uniref:hypothetical protein n=1 Tax=Leifsonia sp. NPDC058230 TaxID=3346391 RepID=UPI0036DA1CD2